MQRFNCLLKFGLYAASMFFAKDCFAQVKESSTNHSLNNIIPPSPNASALGKFGDIPVGYATGVPKINVPIYSYQNPNKELNFTISLDYHAGGVRVDEAASDAGIGWSLNAGGAVSRSVRGIPDETADFGFITATTWPTTESNGNSNNMFADIDAGVRDGQNDIFNFSCGGQSGKFMYGRRGDFLMLSSQKIKVEKTISNVTGMLNNPVISQFIITDENGTKYVFDALETNVTAGAVWPATKHIVSSWYLTKMISPFDTDTIRLEYEDTYYEYQTGKSSSYTIGANSQTSTFPSRPFSSSTSSQVIYGKRIKHIYFPDRVTVNFIYDSNPRQDLIQTLTGAVCNRLKQIAITDGTKTRGFNLYHDYSLNRLTLLKVLPFADATEDKGYEFEYYGGALPARLSDQQDHWGFYNSNMGGQIPQEDVTEIILAGTAVNLTGGNREVDLDRVKYGSLSKMIYPSGGNTVFEMEANMADDERVRRTIYTTPDPHVVNSQSIFCETGTTATGNFSVNPDPNTSVAFEVTFNWGSYTCNGTCALTVELWTATNQILSAEVISLNSINTSVTHNFSRLNMTSGNYVWKVYINGVDNFSEYVNIKRTEIRYQPPVATQIYHPNVGGLRIKKISNYDGVRSSPSTSTEYTYVLEDETTSSGTLGVYPVYSYPVYYEGSTVIEHSYNGAGDPNSVIRASGSIHTLPSVNGSPVAYRRVVEYFKNGTNSNGKIVREFTSYHENPVLTLSPFPFTPPDYKDWTYGQLKKEFVYDRDNILLKKTENEYAYILDNSWTTNPDRYENFRSVSIAPVKYKLTNDIPISSFWSNAQEVLFYRSRDMYPVAGRSDISKTKVTEYLGASSIITETDYTYDTYYNVKTTVTKTSVGDLLEEKNHYSYEYTSSVAEAMQQKNMFDPVIATEKWRIKGASKYLVGGLSNSYSQVSSGIRKNTVFGYESAQPVIEGSVATFNPSTFNRDESLYKPVLQVGAYNSKGFITEQSKENDVVNSYIWDYNQQKPVAQVLNSASAAISYTSFEADGTGGWTVAGSQRNTGGVTGNKYYSLSSGAVSRSGLNAIAQYTVSYWSNSGACSIPGTVGNAQEGRSLTVNGTTWTYFQHLVTGVTSLTISGNQSIDELRFYPKLAQMSTYTYDPLFGITSQCDPGSKIVYYEYDGFGRLKLIRDQDKNVLKTFDYQYQATNN